MTVDRVPLLATPGLDRHAAYVALSRHRDRVDLHYGQDDFVDRSGLVRTLSRERGKDMAPDHVRLPAAEPARQLPPALQRHGRVVRDMRFTNSIGDPHSAEQRTELTASRASLDRLQPCGARDLETALAGEPHLIGEAAAGRTAAVIRAMQLERQRCLFLRDHEDSKTGKIADRMLGMATTLERDPQIESILRIRKAELGLPAMPNRSIGQSLADIVGPSRGRGLGL